MKTLVLIAACFIVANATSAHGAGGFAHRMMVRKTGIKPASVGAYEGVGRSSVSHSAAIATACYAGQRQPVSVQLSTTHNRRGEVIYNAVVRYK